MNEQQTQEPLVSPLQMGISAIGFAVAIFVVMKYGKGKGFWYGLFLYIGTSAAFSGVGYLADSVINGKS